MRYLFAFIGTAVVLLGDWFVIRTSRGAPMWQLFLGACCYASAAVPWFFISKAGTISQAVVIWDMTAIIAAVGLALIARSIDGPLSPRMWIAMSLAVVAAIISGWGNE